MRVHNGAFKSVQFSNGNKNLNSGNYDIKITMPLPQVQPKDVQLAIGKRGENLSGQLVKKSSWGVTVNYATTFQISGDVSKENDAAVRQEANARMREWAKQSCLAIYGSLGPKYEACYADVTSKIPND